MLEACKPLADFVCVSNTKYSTLTVNEMPGTGLLASGALYQPEVDLELYIEWMVLHRDLTGLKVSGANHTSDNVVTNLALAVEGLKESHLKGTREAVRLPLTTVSKAFRDSNTRCLLALCEACDTGDFPPMYQAWAGQQKNDRVQHILQDHLDNCATSFDNEAPFVTTATLKSFQNLRFSGTGGNSISSGLLPFAFIPRHESATTMKHRLEAINQVDTY